MEGPDWTAISDQELLERRISKLGLRLEGTALEPLIRQFYDELSAKGLVFHPPTHIGDEWFVPVGIPAIFVPFFLVHDRLRALEKTMMLEVEGGTKDWFMKLGAARKRRVLDSSPGGGSGSLGIRRSSLHQSRKRLYIA